MVCLHRGIQATAKITYKTILQENLVSPRSLSRVWLPLLAADRTTLVSEQGATLTLWSSCGRSRGGRYGEWQGVICTGETNSPVQVEQEWNEASVFRVVFWAG